MNYTGCLLWSGKVQVKFSAQVISCVPNKEDLVSVYVC